MATITTRAGKGSPLTNTEVDDNFSNLNSAKYESGATPTFGDVVINDVSPAILFQDTSVTNLEHKINSSSDNLRLTVDLNDVDAAGRLEFFVGSATNQIRFGKTESSFNETSKDIDFRVESNSNTHMLFVNAGIDQVAIGSGTISAPSGYQFFSYGAGSGARSAFVHGAGDGGIVVSGSAGGSGASVIFGNNWGTNGATFSEEYRIFMDGADDSLKFKYNANASTAMELASNGFVSIGGDSPLTPLHVKYSAAGELLRLESTDAGAGLGPQIGLYRNSSSPAPGDNLGSINFYGEDSAGNQTTYATIESETYGVSNGTESGRLHFKVIESASLISRLYINHAETVVNESSHNVDFRVESNDNFAALFVDAGNNRVGVFNDAPGYPLSVVGTTEIKSQLYLGSGNSDPGILSIYDTSTTAYTLNFKGTGTRGYMMQGSSSSGNYNLTMQNAGTGLFSLSVDGYGTFRQTDDTGATVTIGGHQDGKLVQFQSGGATRFYIWGQGTGDDYLDFRQSNDQSHIRMYDAEGVVINETSHSADFRVESDSNTHMLFVDAGNNRVGVGSRSTPGYTLDVGADLGSGATLFRLGNTNGTYSQSIEIDFASNKDVGFTTASGSGGLSFDTGSRGFLFNDQQTDTDFRIATVDRATAFHVDAANDIIYINSKESEAASRFTVNNDGSGTGHLQFQTAYNSNANNYVRANIVMSRNKNQITWDTTTEKWNHAGGSSTDWSMLSHVSGGFRAYTGASVASATQFTNTDFNDNYLNYYVTPTGGHTWEAPGGGDFVFNERGLSRDFRVETDVNDHGFFVDAGAGTANINYSIGTKPANAGGVQLQIGNTSNASQIYFDGTSTDMGSVAGGLDNDFAIFTQTGAGAFSQRLKIKNNGYRVVNGVQEYYKTVLLRGDTSYTFDVDVKVTNGTGGIYEVFAGFTHYGTAYAAVLKQVIAHRSNIQADVVVVDTITNFSTNTSGGWTVSYVDSDTIRFTKSAGTYGGQGYGYILVRGHE